MHDSPSHDDSGTSAPSSSKEERGFENLVKDDEYYIESDFVIFQVQDCLFRVPTYIFTNESQTLFGGMFNLPQAGEKIEGMSPDNPIVLPAQYSSEDFHNLLEALYPLQMHLKLSLTTPKWISVLRLSNAWDIQETRRLAISELDRLNELTPLQKVTLGREFRVGSWLVKGLQHFVESPSPMNDATCVELDMDSPTTAARLFRIRWSELSGSSGHLNQEIKPAFKDELDGIRWSKLSGSNGGRLNQEIKQAFKDELDAIRRDEEAFGVFEPEIALAIPEPAPVSNLFPTSANLGWGSWGLGSSNDEIHSSPVEPRTDIDFWGGPSSSSGATKKKKKIRER